ncbi:hypothetical protein CDSM653_02391 [Caldanaerobacter subterraneus subsp. pacificus DSM 12653]|uniref:Uncharacterized protein n=1 Tax=Caldanaerobacter subterraneus subsp. pacificus DSM 12653 TaxID=391606 RepID=A0A0F5PLB2_9THEO|nr:hypothetical protein CDSM653_02391 [Caldanaerobacter subterraneus subsp. pacificus DSM 12653]
MLDEFREALKFLAYLRGIETTARSAKTRVATRFLAYLRGIETTDGKRAAQCQQSF